MKVDFQAVRQLADGNADTAGAKVIAALDKPGGLRVPEQPLKLTLLRGISFLYLRAACLDAVSIMSLGGACRAADAVPAGGTAEQNHHVPGRRTFPADIFRRRRGDNRTDLHTLCRITRMVNLIYNARGKADLIAVGGITRRRGLHDLALRQLAGDRIAHMDRGVRRACDAHGAVNIGAAGKRVADRAADAGGRAAEGFDLGGMVVRFVFEQQQPRLFFAVNRYVYFYRAGVYFFCLVKVFNFSFLF